MAALAGMIMACAAPQPPGDAVAGTYNGTFTQDTVSLSGNCVVTKINDSMVKLVATPDGFGGSTCDSISVSGTGPYVFQNATCFTSASVNGNTLTWAYDAFSFTGTK